MKQLITVYMALIAVLAGASIGVRGSHVHAKKPLEKTQAEAGSTEKASQASHEPTKAEQDCIVRMLSASTLAEAEARKGMCKDSLVLRAYYASLLVQLHAPGADDEIIRNLPRNLAELNAFYRAPDTYCEGKHAKYSTMLMIGHAYERYYKSLFRIVTERPSLLPKFFPIAGRFQAPSYDNLDESGWFCGALNEIYEKLVAQTAAFAVCGFSPIFLRKPADLKPAGPRYGFEPAREVWHDRNQAGSHTQSFPECGFFAGRKAHGQEGAVRGLYLAHR
jgi:hypothetical protein